MDRLVQEQSYYLIFKNRIARRVLAGGLEIVAHVETVHCGKRVGLEFLAVDPVLSGFFLLSMIPTFTSRGRKVS